MFTFNVELLCGDYLSSQRVARLGMRLAKEVAGRERCSYFVSEIRVL